MTSFLYKLDENLFGNSVRFEIIHKCRVTLCITNREEIKINCFYFSYKGLVIWILTNAAADEGFLA